MRVLQETIINAVDATTNPTSIAIDASQWVAASIQGYVTSSASGTLNFQASNEATAPTNWVTLVSVAMTSSNPGMLVIYPCTYNFVRATWTNSSGTGNLTVNLKSDG